MIRFYLVCLPYLIFVDYIFVRLSLTDLSGILIKGDKIEQGTRLLNWNFTILAVSVVHVRSSVTCELYCFYLLLMSLQCPYWWFSNVICGMHHISCISPHKSCLYLKINSQVPSHGSGRTDDGCQVMAISGQVS
jgi:hypothetical protein